MANISRTVDVIFNGKDDLSKTVHAVNASLRDLDSVVQSVAGPLAKVGEALLASEAAALGVAAAIGVHAVKQFGAFETAGANLAKELGSARAATDDLQKSALDLSTTYGVSATSITEIMAAYANVGIESGKIADLTKGALDLMTLESMEAADATNVFIESLKGFGLPAEAATTLMDKLVAVSNDYGVGIDALAVGLKGAAPAASLLGFTLEDTIGLLVPLIDKFHSGEMAAGALGTGLVKLVDDSAEIKGALAQLGVAQTEANGSLRSGKDILHDISVAFQSADDEQKIFLATQLVGTRQAVRMVEVFDGLAVSTGATATALKASGQAAEAVALMLATQEKSWQRLIAMFDAFEIAVGSKLSPSTVEVQDAITGMLSALDTAIEGGALDDIFTMFDDFARRLSTYIGDIAAVLPEALSDINYDKLLDAINGVTDTIQGFFGDVDITTAEGLASALQTAVDTIAGLVNVTDGIISKFKVIFDSFTGGSKSFSELSADAQRSIGDLMGAAIVLKEFGTVMGAALLSLQGAGVDMEGVFGTVVGSIQVLLNGLLIGADMLAVSIAGILYEALTILDTYTLGFFTSIHSMKDAVGEFVKGGLTDMGEKWEKAAKGVDTIINGFEGTAEAADKATGAVKGVKAEVDTVPSEKVIDWGVVWNDMQAADVKNKIEKDLPDKREMEFIGTVNGEDIWRAKEEIETIIPAKKPVMITPEVAIEQFKAETDRIDALLDFQATINTAQIEADTKRIQAAFESISDTIQSTGDVIISLFGQLADTEVDLLTRWKIEDQIRAENERREESLRLERELTEAQIEALRKRTEALARGDALIKVDGTPLKPHLEAIMWEILAAIQVRVNEDFQDFLLGIGGA